MARLVTILACGVLFYGTQLQASVQSAETKTVKLRLGLGWQLCPTRSEEPPIELAFMCSGLAAGLEDVELVLERKPAAKPQWKYFEAKYDQQVKFHDITSTVELLVMYAEYDGLTSGFIDGRISSEKDGVKTKAVYFRSSAAGGLEKLNYQSFYGADVPFPIGSSVSQFSPYVALQGW